MRILDMDNVELEASFIDSEKGYTIPERVFVAHHDAVEAVEEQGHWEIVAEYPETGGKDVEWIPDVPGVIAREAWDEYEDILRYVAYTAEELAEREAVRRAAAQREKRLEALLESAVLREEVDTLVTGLFRKLWMARLEGVSENGDY